MIYRHERTQGLYRYLGDAFNVETQQTHVLYCSLSNGALFTRNKRRFGENFTLVDCDPQGKIVPKDPHD